MKDWSKLIRNFRLEIEDIRDGNGLNEFKIHYTFHVRSELHKHYNSLSDAEKIELSKADLLLLQNVEMVYNHLSKKYDFRMFKQPIEEWWWNLDKITSGEILFESIKTVQKKVGKPAKYTKGFARVDLLGDDEG
jgi:hypothetical protein